MVRIHTFLLALAFATGLILASSDGYHRRVDKHALFDERSGTFDEPKAQSLLSSMFKVGDEVGEKAINLNLKGRVGTDILEHRSAVLNRREPAVGNRRSQKKLSKQHWQEPPKKQLNNEAQQANKNTGRSRGLGPARMLARRDDEKGCVVC